MSTSVESSAASPWRKRPHEDLNIDIKELKRPRHYYFRLESESSKASDDESESIYSVQDKETDVVRDTSDTESRNSDEDHYDIELEYEVASLSENDEIEGSTTDSEGMMLAAAAAAVICDSSLERWVTDVEDSDSSSDETSLGRTDFNTCVQCKGENLNPLYRYCEKCFQNCRQCNKHKTYKCFPLCRSCFKDRKKFFPPRPRRNRRRNQPKPAQKEEAVQLDTLKSCLSGLSPDSGIGSSQECPALGLEQIVVPAHLQGSGTSKSEDITSLQSSISLVEDTECDFTKSDISNGKEPSLKRKRHSSESSLSDFDVKKPKIASKSEHITSDLGSEVSSTSSFASSVSSFSSETSGFHSERSGGSVSLEKSNSFGSDKSSETELCMFCNSAPKNSIFLHTNIAHRCCCYPCAKKTLKSIKRCPICNGTVNKVVKIFTS